MSTTQCVLALAALYLGLAHSWDFAVSAGNQLIFFTYNGTEINTVDLIPHNATALSYDEVHNIMLYVDKQSYSEAICGYNLLSKENKCYIKRYGSNIHSIAFDPATDTLFFTDTNEMSINWISLKPGSNNNVNGNLLIKIDDNTPSDIAVDSCRGYIYWTNTDIAKDVYIERARLNGSERKVVSNVLLVHGMAMDLLKRKIYYFDGSMTQFLNKRDLDSDINAYYLLKYTYFSEAKELTVSNDYLYWMNINENYRTIWRLPKYAMKGVEPTPLEIRKFHNERPLGIVANYKIKDQIPKLQQCEALSSLIPTIPVTSQLTTEYTTVAEPFCVHGIKVGDTSVCKCTPGYIGERCDVSVCENYCLQGNCSFNDEGLPKCRCNAGYSGERCEASVCYKYCSNNGTCSLNEKSEPVFQCKGDYVGDRCEVSDCLNYCIHGECTFNGEGHPKCRCNAGYFGERCEVYACYGYCLNNGDCSLNEENEPVCQCIDNHEGKRCEAVTDKTSTCMSITTFSAEIKHTLADLLSQCLNYCLQGICSFTDDGPFCRCNAGYSGARCEVYACHGYCLNNGVCSLNEEDDPVCQCVGNYDGTRCEAVNTLWYD